LQNQPPSLVLLGSDNPTTWIVYNRLVREFGPFPALIEQHVSRRKLFRTRARKLGWGVALSQVAFVKLIRPILNRVAKRRIRQICQGHGLECIEPLSTHINHIDSANSDVCESFLRGFKADVVIVNGARILKPNILKATSAPFINTHQGITPQYRGAHGAYWALLNNDADRCGVTVHLIDEGIDTGNIIGQSRIAPQADDNFTTYPYLQTAAALPILLEAISSSRLLKTSAITGPSNLWYHPGFFTYIFGRLRGVK
jgi:folate-dependent phosphoribosylglycinamide formyltransferase PurN